MAETFLIHNIPDQIIDGLDVLYEDFKSRGIKLADSIHVVKKQIGGIPQEEIERILLFLRSGKKDIENLRIRNSEGNIVKFIVFP